MSQLTWLEETTPFPDVSLALEEPNGLLAASADLSTERLIDAYRRGIFPWYDDGQPVLWWSPDPRCVIDPRQFKPSRSLAKQIKKEKFQISVDQNFAAVIRACREWQPDRTGTWISDEMEAAYIRLHELGISHSVECYEDDVLVGGLYGVSIGRLFFGESMFHRVTDASKVAFAALMKIMADQDCPMVDCQLPNPHLASLGASEIPRTQFLRLLEDNIDLDPINWLS